ncbi:hypothetical protein CEP54_012111 [Fusarium duplospermum]|uniref:Uncharacterized protein n=1 Tax=Fusarium duplospermum TaxID=1325734 RepID=A0A428PAF3_9HYPO|nr:hypothetical protein CEP54_012111 [Fusarium duplospermum]
MLPTLISATFWHQLRDIICDDRSALDRLDVRCAACKQHMTVGTDDWPMEESHVLRILPCGHMIPPTIGEAFTGGLVDIYNSLDVSQRPLPNHQFYAFSVTLDGDSYSVLTEGAMHLKSLEIPADMREIVKEAKKQFLDQWKGMWRTWQVGEFEVRFDRYEDTKYDSTKAKIKRSVKNLQRALDRKP